MTLYDFLKDNDNSYDVADTVFDCIVTVCPPYDGDEWYDKFCNFILKHVEYADYVDECDASAYWYDFIDKNIDEFRRFANDMWAFIPNDNDDLIYEWIEEIHAWMAGNVSEDVYKYFMDKYAPNIKGCG